MSKENKTEHNKKKLIESMEKSLGVVTTACRLAEIGRTTYYEYYKTDEAFRLACDDIENIALDFAESQLHKQIKGGNPTSTIFFLKTKGKKRGYFEKQINENKNTIIGVGNIPMMNWVDSKEDEE
jgi:hypothetical protein